MFFTDFFKNIYIYYKYYFKKARLHIFTTPIFLLFLILFLMNQYYISGLTETFMSTNLCFYCYRVPKNQQKALWPEWLIWTFVYFTAPLWEKFYDLWFHHSSRGNTIVIGTWVRFGTKPEWLSPIKTHNPERRRHHVNNLWSNSFTYLKTN